MSNTLFQRLLLLFIYVMCTCDGYICSASLQGVSSISSSNKSVSQKQSKPVNFLTYHYTTNSFFFSLRSATYHSEIFRLANSFDSSALVSNLTFSSLPRIQTKVRRTSVELKNINVKYGSRDILKGLNLRVDPGDKIGMVGINGSGKTTILKIIAGEIQIGNPGSVIKSPKDIIVGYFRQNIIEKYNVHHAIHNDENQLNQRSIDVSREITQNFKCDMKLPDNDNKDFAIKEHIISSVHGINDLLEKRKTLEWQLRTLTDINEDSGNNFVKFNSSGCNNTEGKAENIVISNIIRQLCDVNYQLEALNVYNLENRISSILNAIGFDKPCRNSNQEKTENGHNGDDSTIQSSNLINENCKSLFITSEKKKENSFKSFNQLSGGWKMRVELGRILMMNPDILVMDEPTNNLDFQSILWIEEFLNSQQIPYIVVSHDGQFLQNVCNKIVEVHNGKCTIYNGTYKAYLQKKSKEVSDIRNKWIQKKKQMIEIRHFIQKHRNKATNRRHILSQIGQKEEELKNLRSFYEENIESWKHSKIAPFRFIDNHGHFGQNSCLFSIQNLTLYYEKKTADFQCGNTKVREIIFDDVNLPIYSGDRIGLIGENGSGKTSLLRFIIGEIACYNGEICKLNHIKIGHLSQHMSDSLHEDLSIYEYFFDSMVKNSTGCPTTFYSSQSANVMSENDNLKIFEILGRFRFRKEDMYKKIKLLSGGEKSRLALCKLLLQPYDVILLDEPTNHMDNQTKIHLINALQAYSGSYIICSHDFQFLSQVINSVVCINNKKLLRFNGDLKSFMDNYLDILDKINIRILASNGDPICHAPTQICPDYCVDFDLCSSQMSLKKRKTFGGKGKSGKIKGFKNIKRWT